MTNRNRNRDRMTARAEGDFVVFLIGMRVNRIRNIRTWWPLFMSMPRMLAELGSDRDAGFLGGESWFGLPTIMVQYWRSFEHLERYARDADRLHRPAWAAFNRALRSGVDVGIWHEVYQIRAGEYEALYHNMPRFGLARAFEAAPATGSRESARGRLHHQWSDPTEA